MQDALDYLSPSELEHGKREGEFSVTHNLDRPEDVLLEDLETGLRQYKAPDVVFSFVRKAWNGLASRGGVTASISAYIQQEADEIRRDTVRTLLSMIMQSSDARLTTHVLAISTGIHVPGIESEMQLAEMYGITRQAVSKRATETCRELGLPPSRYMRSEDAQEAYRQRENKKVGTVKEFLLRRSSHETSLWLVYP